jgi:hypothetical protein
MGASPKTEEKKTAIAVVMAATAASAPENLDARLPPIHLGSISRTTSGTVGGDS